MLEIVLAVVVFLALIAVAIYFVMKKAKSIEAYKTQYQKALQSGDKKKALEAGRDYYAAKNGGFIKSIDEQALANDIAAM